MQMYKNRNGNSKQSRVAFIGFTLTHTLTSTATHTYIHTLTHTHTLSPPPSSSHTHIIWLRRLLWVQTHVYVSVTLEKTVHVWESGLSSVHRSEGHNQLQTDRWCRYIVSVCESHGEGGVTPHSAVKSVSVHKSLLWNTKVKQSLTHTRIQVTGLDDV